MIVDGLWLEVVDLGIIAQNTPLYCIFVLTIKVKAWVRLRTPNSLFSFGDRIFLLSHSAYLAYPFKLFTITISNDSYK